MFLQSTYKVHTHTHYSKQYTYFDRLIRVLVHLIVDDGVDPKGFQMLNRIFAVIIITPAEDDQSLFCCKINLQSEARWIGEIVQEFDCNLPEFYHAADPQYARRCRGVR